MVYIIVEGITDKALVKNILSDKKEKSDFNFLGLKGIDSVKKTIEKLTEHDLSQHAYFAIVDADTSFESRNEEMSTLTGTKGIEYYIFPNNKDNGDLETLLLSHIPEENETIKCFDAYETCVTQVHPDNKIDNKAKLYAYTTLEHDKKPEQYIQELDIGTNFDGLKQKLQTLFEG